ncbi:hypothetical protein [Flavobacterium pallidum]|uniref:Uncharacterized protein n=1 Tax=Flavobacterium pallidum TaxID=2172098 RepID=A0A2S1SFC7_9FLAO|nr:hypothetical protein [Flavobacterium pallidum]AWI25072.1 hypothetical protein HYN49_03725 [Flavobacterium pallidum]
MSFIKLLYKKIYQKLNYDVQKALLLNGKILSNQNNQKQQIKSLDEVEFQVFSQRGEDGIIQYIINKIEIPNKIFVEFGVETYTESNTRFLLFNDNWSGLVIDGSEKNVDFIKKDLVYWKYDLVAVNSFITKENINKLIGNYTSVKDIGLLSVDIDGNDYWVWEQIDCINPRIVVCEYNSAFGSKKKVTVPYKQDFVRSKEHYSELYFGASLAAFCDLADKKGYDFIGTTRAGVNAYFVRKDLSAPFLKYNPETGFNESANRDSKNEKGELLFLRHHERLKMIEDLPVFDIEKQQLTKIKDINWSQDK